MTFNKTLILITVLLTFLLSGCSQTEEPKPTANTNKPANATNSAVTETNAPPPFNGTTKQPEAPTTNNAPTLTPVVMAFYEALKKKDEAALKRVFSQKSLKMMEADMKTDEVTSLVEFITNTEMIPDRPFEVRNEQIQGDTAVAEIRGGSYPNGIRRIFVKENGEWKMTNDSPELKSAGK